MLTDVTLVIVPRERFSFTAQSLESIYEQTPGLENVVYVDGGSPAHVRRYLEEQSSLRGFTLVRTEGYLSPNRARNVGLRHVRTPFVVFVDNDVIVEPAWLEHLVTCARETDAAVVGPLYYMNIGGRLLVHMAGGGGRIEVDGEHRYAVEEHRLYGVPAASAPALRREPVELVEFHTMLVRMSALERTGPFDEGLLSISEHVDFCMLVRDLGLTVYFEPRSVVTYVPAMRLHPSDIPFYSLRWSERWNRASFERLTAKWHLDRRDARNRKMIVQGRHMRCRGLRLVRDSKHKTRAVWLRDRVVVAAERCVNTAYTAIASRRIVHP